MALASPPDPRVTVNGKFFRLETQKFYLKGLTYGPFAPNALHETFASREQTARDFQQIGELGANLLRVYYVPPRWFLDLAAEKGLKLLIDIPWAKHLCFLDSEESQEAARDTVRQAVRACDKHPAVFAFSVANEIPAEIVRWSGVRAVEEFIDELVDEVKKIDPDCLCTFASFPPTEFLRPRNIDFICFNVYLHRRGAFESYLARLQMLAEGKPLVLGEFGMDSIREGEHAQGDALAWQVESAFRAGLAGTVIFSYTDDWFRGGQPIEDWAFGLTTRDRRSKESFGVVQKMYHAAPYFPLPRRPKVSVVVACYNGARTLGACLDSLSRLNYPNYEVILVDDGSTDNTFEIARLYPQVHTIRQLNHGLSVARDTGLAAATGEIVAFTDADCRPDEDWLYYLAADLGKSEFAGIGGPNLLPPDDSFVAAAVLVSPGGPAHVMLNDREDEHIPGCNMAFYKWVLEEIAGFDPVFRKAGDDVDVCWRLQERGYKIGFSPAGFVWHYRRSTIQAYLTQQTGYGEAEALLAYKHPEYFNWFGGGVWRGRIYTTSKFGVTLQRPIIYHGLFGSGFFQKLYTPEPAFMVMLCTSLEYHALVTLPLLVLSVSFPILLPVALASIFVSLGVCIMAAAQADLPKKKKRVWSRPLVAFLFFLQPIVRGWARYRWRLRARSRLDAARQRAALRTVLDAWESPEKIVFWAEGGVDRYAFLKQVQAKLDQEGWQYKPDSGWSHYDLEIFGNRWSRLCLTTVTEELEQGKRNFCCRLQATWSLPAKLLFWFILGVELVLIGLLAPVQPWLWMILLSLAVLNGLLEQEKLRLQQVIATLLGEVAAQLSMVKVKHNQNRDEPFHRMTPFHVFPQAKDLKN
ncbi:MAG: glycosyl transferase [Verrucomicrobia bacterium]|nr:MAG: glycosyl transferase [Verrucomicrobiota bacterium]